MDIKSITADLRDRLNSRKGTGDWAKISDAAGLDHSWLSKFASADNTNPTIRSLESLERELNRLDYRDRRIANPGYTKPRGV